jgi:hypothetical protein
MKKTNLIRLHKLEGGRFSVVLNGELSFSGGYKECFRYLYHALLKQI